MFLLWVSNVQLDWKIILFVKMSTEKILKIEQELKDVFERNYSILKTFKTIYLYPIQQNKFLTQEEYEFCFKNIEEALLIYKTIYTEIEALSDNSEHLIIDIFQKNFPFFKIYTQMISNFEEVVLKLEKNIEKNKNFKDFVEKIRKEDTIEFVYKNITNPEELFIISGGRSIPRFNLLFKEMLK